MNRLSYSPIFILCLIFCAVDVFAQRNTPPLDNLPVDRPGVFDLVFTRAFTMAPTTAEDGGAAINSLNSGTLFIGASLRANFSHGRFGFRFQPGIAITQLTYTQEPSKSFPTVFNDSLPLDLERHRLTFVEMPVGIFYNIIKDEDGDPRFFIEGGGFAGYKIGGAYITKETNSLDQVERHVVKDVLDLENFRYGLYFRTGYKWISVYYSYRLSDVFTEFRSDANGVKTSFRNPSIPAMELGITIIL